jgi:TPR repeat protein
MAQTQTLLPQNYAEAAKWYRLAADQGNPYGQGSLGNMYRFSGDYVRAHIWFNVSAAQGDQLAAKNRDDIAERMTPAQIAEAQKLAREWQPKRP